MGVVGGSNGRRGAAGNAGSSGPFGIGGLADAFRKERAGMQEVPGVARRVTPSGDADGEATPREARDAAMAGPLARGAVDPTTLLGYDEVEALTGDRIDDSVVGFAPSFVSVAFRGAEGTYRLASIHGVEGGSRWKAAKVWKRLLEGYPDAVPVSGLGDAAACSGPFTLVRSGEAILFVEVNRIGASTGAGDAGDLAQRLLRAAIDRVGGEPAGGPA